MNMSVATDNTSALLLYNRIDGVENFHRYQPGGLHPVRIGEEFDKGRYFVINKSGYGVFAIV